MYREITRILLSEIREGAYVRNKRMPTEAQLSERFGVSRFTVREALRAIEEMGLISRRPGAGTTLQATEFDSRFANSISSIDDLLQYARTTRFKVRSVSTLVPGAKLTSRIGRAVEGEWRKVVGLRVTEDDGRPICLTEIYLPIELDEIVPRIGTLPVAVYQMIEETYGLRIESIEQEIEADVLTRNAANMLDADLASPALRISRRYFTAEQRLIEASVNVHPAGAYRYAMTLHREAGLEMGRRGGQV